LSLGIALRRQGVPVIVHEAGDYPRHRVCGELIAGLAPSTLERLGIAEAFSGARQHREVAWSIDSQRPRIQRLPEPALGISRHLLDARLARRFVENGGTLLTRSRISGGPAAPGRVFATGRRRAAEPRWIGLKIHVRGLELTRDLEMHLGTDCYVGLARVHDEAVNVCGLFRRRAHRGTGVDLLLSFLEASRLGALAARLRRAAPDPDSFCAVAALGFGRSQPDDALLRIGDAIAMIPPFTGNGMAMAFQSAEIALEPLLAYARGEMNWDDATRLAHAALRARFRLRLAAANTLHPFLLRPRAQRWFATLSRARLLPFAPLYASTH
jgi:2-polyprenyl-6-methoxyphenol hydroxylase-like FAD-dependent oxidoreductase